MLLFCDSFDHYSLLSTKGYGTTGNAGLASGAGRYRDACYTQTTSVSGNGGEIRRFVPNSEVIVGGAIKVDDLRAFRWDFREGSTVHVSVTVNAGGHVEVRRGSGGTLLGTGTATLAVNTYAYLEARVLVDNTAGLAEIRVNGTQDVLVTGTDTANGGTATLDRWAHVTNYLGALVPSATSYLDDLVIVDGSSFLGDARVEALIPNGNGNSSQWIGSDGNSTDNYQLVDEVPADADTTYVESSTIGNKDTYACSDVKSTTGQVFAVQTSMYAKTDTARTIAAVARSGMTEDTAAGYALHGYYEYVVSVFEHDPATSGDWTIDAINAAEFGMKVTA